MMLKYFIALTLVAAYVVADDTVATEPLDGQLVAKKHEKRGLSTLGYSYDAPLGYNNNYNSVGYNRLVSPISYSRGGGYSDYTTGGGYNAGYNTGYNTGYSGLGGRYTAGGYTSGLGGYNGLNAAYGAPYTSTIGTGYSSLGGYSSGLGGYSGVGAYSGLGGYSGFAGSYPNTRASYVAPLSSSVYNQNSGYYY